MSLTVERPAAGSDRGGPSMGVPGGNPSKNSRIGGRAQHRLTFRLPPDGGPVTVFGRMAQTLDLLIRMGPKGFTSGEASPLGWARRTSHYVLKLRALGVPIATTWERAGDARVGRYSLAGSVVMFPEGSDA